VLTDGKPNDVDHYEGRFAVEDTRKAVRESAAAARRGIRRHGRRKRAVLLSCPVRARRLRHRRQHPSIVGGASLDLSAIGPLKGGRAVLSVICGIRACRDSEFVNDAMAPNDRPDNSRASISRRALFKFERVA
jgi:hypothetical protein